MQVAKAPVKEQIIILQCKPWFTCVTYPLLLRIQFRELSSLVSPLLATIGSPLAFLSRRHQAIMNLRLLSNTGQGNLEKRNPERYMYSESVSQKRAARRPNFCQISRGRVNLRPERFAFLVGTTLPLSIDLFVLHSLSCL